MADSIAPYPVSAALFSQEIDSVFADAIFPQLTHQLKQLKTLQGVCKAFLNWSVRPACLDSLFTSTTLGVLKKSEHAVQFLHIPQTHKGANLKLNLSQLEDLSSDKLKEILKRWPHLVFLNLNSTNSQVDDLLQTLPESLFLTALNVHRCKLSDRHLPLLFKAYPKLKIFTFSIDTITIKALAPALPDDSPLQSLNLTHARPDSYAPSELTTLIKKCSQLTELNVSVTTVTGEEIFLGLAENSCFQELYFGACTSLNEKAVASIVNKSPQLEKLFLNSTSISGVELATCSFPSLRRLNLNLCWRFENSSLIQIIKNSPKLESLSLSELLITGGGLLDALQVHQSVTVITGLATCSRLAKGVKEEIDAYLKAPSD